MADEQARYYRRMRRLRRSARRWSVLAGTLGGAAVVLTPYAGLSLVDAAWMSAAGGSVALAVWRWLDLRAFAQQTPPSPTDPAVAAARIRHRVEALIDSVPGGREALGELRRRRDRVKLGGSSVAPGARRLDKAAVALQGLSSRLGGPAEGALLEAAIAERGLRELAERAASVERGLRFATGEAHTALVEAHRVLVEQFERGVAGYEALVGAAAAYVAEDGRATEHPSVNHLTEATDLLRGIAMGFVELRTATSEQGAR